MGASWRRRHATADSARWTRAGRPVLRTAAGLTVMVTSRRVPPFSLVQLTSCGLDPTSFDLIVAKGVHAPVAAYAPVCRELVRVNTPGVTRADMTRLEYRRRRRPMFPFEPETEWTGSAGAPPAS